MERRSPSARHHVRRQRIDLAVGREATAFALQPHLATLNRRSWLPVIERVLDEVAGSDVHLHLDRLELDLGTLPHASLERLEEEVARRIESALRHALADALTNAESGASTLRTRTAAESRGELLESYLRSGTLPFWAAERTADFSLDELVGILAAESPDELVARLRAVAGSNAALERLVRQLGESTLAALTRRLEPRHAALILAYLAGLREVHRLERLVALSDREMAVTLWTLTHAYLLRDPGSQFNRKSFVRRLLTGVAEREGIELAALLETLGRGLARAGRRGPLRSSLPGVVAALLGEQPGESPRETDLTAAETPLAIASLSPSRATLAWLAEEVAGRRGWHTAALPGRWRSPRGLTPAAWLDVLLAGLGPVRPGTPEARLAAAIRAARERLPRRTAPAARPLAARYAGADALRYFLAHGVLPWTARLSSPPLTLGTLAGELPRWPTALLADALAAVPGGDSAGALWRVARHVPEGELVRWLLRLMPAAREPDSPLRASLGAFAAQARDRGWFFARAIAAVVAGEMLDFEALAAAPPESVALPALGSPSSWPAHRLQSALVARLLGDPETAVALPPPGELLTTLARRAPEDARDLLQTLETTPGLGTGWLRDSPEATFDEVARELYPRQLPGLQALVAALERVPAPYRPRPADALRGAVWGELWRRGDGADLDTDFFAAVLGRLFAHPLAAPVARFLRRDAARWGLSSPAGTRQRDAFLAALDRAGGAAEPAETSRPEPPALPAEARRRAALFALLRGEEPAGIDPTEIAHRLDEALAAAPVETYGLVRRGFADARTRERWSRELPEAALAKLVALVEPTHHRRLLDTAELLLGAWTSSRDRGAEPPLGRRELWRALLAFVAEPGGAPDVAGFVRWISEHLAELPGLVAGSDPERSARAESWLERAASEAQAAGRPALAATLAKERAALLAPWRARAAPPRAKPLGREPQPARTAKRRPEREIRGSKPKTDSKSDRTEPEAIYVGNAGLVLLAPFLPRFFDRLSLVETPPPEGEDERPKPRFRDAEAVSRAVHLLQYLVDGSLETPEPALVLNKLLCGVDPATPVEPGIEPSADELAVCDSLLPAVISQWTAIGSTSIEGLRETFLVREGRLHRGDDGWRLRVQRKTVDFLVDEVPWSFRVVFHPWMASALHITW